MKLVDGRMNFLHFNNQGSDCFPRHNTAHNTAGGCQLLCNEKTVLGTVGHACDTRFRSHGVGQCPYCDLRPAWVTLRDPLSKTEKQNQHLKPASGIRKRVSLFLDAYFTFYRTCCSSSLSIRWLWCSLAVRCQGRQ